MRPGDGFPITSFRHSRPDPGLVASALVLVAVCIVVAGLLAYAGSAAAGACNAACACGEAPR